MAIVEANGFGVIEARISLPRAKVWHADLVVDTGDVDKITGAVEISIGGGALKLSGTARRPGTFIATGLVRVIGGAAGLAKAASPKSYTSTALRTPLGDILQAAGESLDATADSAVVDLQLAGWSVLGHECGTALTNLVRVNSADAVWRILPNGKVWVGVDQFADSGIDFDLERDAPQEARIDIASEAPLLLPGTSLDGRHVSYVEHHVTSGRVRSSVWFE